jgi:subtilisin family serine protease
MPVIDQDYSENVVFSGDFARRTVTAPVAGADYVEFLDATDGLVKRCLISALPGGGGGGAGNTGIAEVDFGAFPGVSDASVAVTGQAAIDSSTSQVQAWLMAKATTDHTADEHRIETISVTAGNIVTGTGFTIYAQNTSQLNEPLQIEAPARFRQTAASIYGTSGPSIGGIGTRIWGKWTVAWRWS